MSWGMEEEQEGRENGITQAEGSDREILAAGYQLGVFRSRRGQRERPGPGVIEDSTVRVHCVRQTSPVTDAVKQGSHSPHAVLKRGKACGA